MSIEQMCRDLLMQAIADGLVRDRLVAYWKEKGPQALTTGELVGMANMLAGFFKQKAEREGQSP